MEPGGNEGPCLPEDHGTGQDEAGENPHLEVEKELVNRCREVQRFPLAQHMLDRAQNDLEDETGDDEADDRGDAPGKKRDDEDPAQLLEVLDDRHTSLVVRSNDRWFGHGWRWLRRGLRRPWYPSATLRRRPGRQGPGGSRRVGPGGSTFSFAGGRTWACGTHATPFRTQRTPLAINPGHSHLSRPPGCIHG